MKADHSRRATDQRHGEAPNVRWGNIGEVETYTRQRWLTRPLVSISDAHEDADPARAIQRRLEDAGSGFGSRGRAARR